MCWKSCCLRWAPKQLPDYDRKQITALVDGYIEQYFKEEMGDPSDMPSRFRYNFRRLSKMLVDVVCRLAGEFAESDFEAKAFELPIDVDGAVHSKVIPLQDGGSLRIRGSVDRVDVLEQDGQQFVRVVDYKSGLKALSSGRYCQRAEPANVLIFV